MAGKCGSKKYEYRNDFFDTWSAEMAYILGFTMADGSVANSGKDHRLTYGVKSTDICVLEFIQKYLCPEKAITLEKQTRRNTICCSARYKIYSKIMVDKLAKYNIIQSKTGKEQLPAIPDNYKPDYLRGLFDGDGCVNISNRRTGQLSFQILSASKQFLIDVQQQLGYNFGYIRPKQNIFVWYVYTQEHIYRLFQSMYYDGYEFCLERKHRIFQERFKCQKKWL